MCHRVAAGDLREGGVVLAEHHDRGLERADGLEHVLLLGVELGELLLADRRRLRQRLLVLRDLRLEVPAQTRWITTHIHT